MTRRSLSRVELGTGALRLFTLKMTSDYASSPPIATAASEFATSMPKRTRLLLKKARADAGLPRGPAISLCFGHARGRA
jgi:hypothetical protein